MALIFHRLVQKDLRTVLEYYTEEGGAPLADRFFAEIEALVACIARDPKTFHQVPHGLRRANMIRFPYHFLFRESIAGVRILILRHHKRHPKFGHKRS